MVDEPYKLISRRTWHRWSFYVNIALFFIIAISSLLLITDSYRAGELKAAGNISDLSQQWLIVARDVAFLSISLTLVFFQFFRNLLIIIKRSL